MVGAKGWPSTLGESPVAAGDDKEHSRGLLGLVPLYLAPASDVSSWDQPGCMTECGGSSPIYFFFGGGNLTQWHSGYSWL